MVAVVTFAPVFWLGVADPLDRSALERREQRVAELAQELADAEAAERAGLASRVADEDRVRVRLLVGGELVEFDRPGARRMGQSAEEAARDQAAVRAWDGARGPLTERDEVVRARGTDGFAGCVPADGFVVCEAAVWVEGAVEGAGAAGGGAAAGGGESLVHVQSSSIRPIRTLYDQRFQVLRLAGFVLPLGLLLGLWLGWRMVRPLERLRRQARARAALAARGAPTPPLAIGRADEFGDLADAFNELLGVLDGRTRRAESRAGELVHELKNPVAAVRTAGEALERGDLDPERLARIARILRSSTARLDRVISAFLAFARAEAGLSDRARELVDWRALVERLAAEDPQIELAPGPPVAVFGAPEPLEDAVRNLLRNAATWADPEDPTVRVALDAAGRLRVSDSGPGVPPEHRERIFDRFFTTRREQGGTGLGLALVRAVAEAHGGRVWLEEGPTTFVLELPVAQGP